MPRRLQTLLQCVKRTRPNIPKYYAQRAQGESSEASSVMRGFLVRMTIGHAT